MRETVIIEIPIDEVVEKAQKVREMAFRLSREAEELAFLARTKLNVKNAADDDDTSSPQD